MFIGLTHIILIIGVYSLLFYALCRITKYAFILGMTSIVGLIVVFYHGNDLAPGILYVICPLLFVHTFIYVFFHKQEASGTANKKYRVSFKTNKGSFQLENIKRGASVIGSAGSGKT